jgi:hypothetical protein
MKEIWATRDIKITCDDRGNVRILQLDPNISPAIAVNVISLSATGAEEVAKCITQLQREHREVEFHRRRSA